MSPDSKFAPPFESLNLTDKEEYLIRPFFTNLDRPVFAVSMIPPEVIGALCSRASRAKGDLRIIFLQEFIRPFLTDNTDYGKALQQFIDFLHENPTSLIFSNPKGREFYVKWLAQYGDDSIAQMGGTHLVYSELSFVAIKHFEEMRVGIAPIEKSTRYVDYSNKINGKYRYYTDPTLAELGLLEEYTETMDLLFDTYTTLSHKYYEYLKTIFPNEKEILLKTKTFDTVRGILPISTLSQVAFYANGQAFEYAISRSLKHKLAEVRWAGTAAYEELLKTIPAFIRRLQDDTSIAYQEYLTNQKDKANEIKKFIEIPHEKESTTWGVTLLEYDENGENKVIAGFLYPFLHQPYEQILATVNTLTDVEKESVLEIIFKDRTARWYKTPRALEHAYLKFEVTANWGVWKDLQRHRMLTEQHELFSTHHGYSVPQELIDAKLDAIFVKAIEKTTELFNKIEQHDPYLAQYAVTQTHYLRFLQYQNLRSFFWESELRTIAQGHPDYRLIEQEKVKLVSKIYPLISKHLKVDMNDYTFARRGSEDVIKQKEQKLQEYLSSK